MIIECFSSLSALNRFTLSYHRTLQDQSSKNSALTTLPGAHNRSFIENHNILYRQDFNQVEHFSYDPALMQIAY